MKCRHYDQIIPGCRYCDSIVESERQERMERERAILVETLEGRLACETALVDNLRAENARLRAALEAIASESRGECRSQLDLIRGAARAALGGAR